MQKKKIIFILILWVISTSFFSPMWVNIEASDPNSDPLIINSSYLGGMGLESIKEILIDSQGNIVAVGVTFSTDFPTLHGFQLEYGGGNPNDDYIFGGDGFITKFNQIGSLLWSTFLGGSGLDQINAAVLDAEDNILVCGNTESDDFPITSDALADTKFSSSKKDGFVAKIDSNGSLLYASYLGGTDEDLFHSCAFDLNWNLYFTGGTMSDDFPLSNNAVKSELSDGFDAFLLTLSPDLSSIIYSSYLGGSFEDMGNNIIVDQNDDVLISGYTYSPDFPLLEEIDVKTTSDFRDIFISKFNGDNLTELQFSTVLSSSDREDPYSIATDSKNNIILTGRTFAEDFPVHSPIQSTHADGEVVDAIFMKVDPFAAELSYSSYFGGIGWDSFYDIEINQDDEIYMCGIGDDDFQVKNPIQAESAGSGDVVISKFNSQGELNLSTFFGGTGYDHCLTMDIEGNRLIIAGFTRSSDFNITSNAFQSKIKSEEDGFITIFDLNKFNENHQNLTIGVAPILTYLITIPSICGIIFWVSKKNKK